MNFHAVKAIYRFEMARTFRTLMQSIAAPVLSTSLYFIVFGAGVLYILRLMSQPPRRGEEGPERDQPVRAAGDPYPIVHGRACSRRPRRQRAAPPRPRP